MNTSLNAKYVAADDAVGSDIFVRDTIRAVQVDIKAKVVLIGLFAGGYRFVGASVWRAIEHGQAHDFRKQSCDRGRADMSSDTSS